MHDLNILPYSFLSHLYYSSLEDDPSFPAWYPHFFLLMSSSFLLLADFIRKRLYFVLGYQENIKQDWFLALSMKIISFQPLFNIWLLLSISWFWDTSSASPYFCLLFCKMFIYSKYMLRIGSHPLYLQPFLCIFLLQAWDTDSYYILYHWQDMFQVAGTCWSQSFSLQLRIPLIYQNVSLWNKEFYIVCALFTHPFNLKSIHDHAIQAYFIWAGIL